MFSKPHVALGLALALVSTSVVQAQASTFGGWGVAVYEKPAPTPETPPGATTSVAPSKQKRSHESRERAAAVHRRGAAARLASRDVQPAPTPATMPDVPTGAGPVEAAAPTLRDLVTKHARENGIPDKLAAAVVNIESRFNPRARGGSALGLMQIKYNTARSMGYAGGITELLTPDTNLHFGMKVLADAYKSSNGDLCMTLARYQSGHRVQHASAANRVYCAKARAYMARAF